MRLKEGVLRSHTTSEPAKLPRQCRRTSTGQSALLLRCGSWVEEQAPRLITVRFGGWDHH